MGNRFNRITLVNYDKTERLTIDFGIQFYNYATENRASMNNIVVIELKRDGRCPSPILPILRQLRIKPAGFSKYCIGASVPFYISSHAAHLELGNQHHRYMVGGTLLLLPQRPSPRLLFHLHIAQRKHIHADSLAHARCP